MTDTKDQKLALFELYLATAEKVSDRRAQANSWMLGVNSAIVSLYGYLQPDKVTTTANQRALIWLWAIPIAGMLVSLAWAALLNSYRELNRAKFEVLAQMEVDLQFPPLSREREIYGRNHRSSLSLIERFIPFCFVLLYASMLVAAIVNRNIG